MHPSTRRRHLAPEEVADRLVGALESGDEFRVERHMAVSCTARNFAAIRPSASTTSCSCKGGRRMCRWGYSLDSQRRYKDQEFLPADRSMHTTRAETLLVAEGMLGHQDTSQSRCSGWTTEDGREITCTSRAPLYDGSRLAVVFRTREGHRLLALNCLGISSAFLLGKRPALRESYYGGHLSNSKMRPV